MKKLQSIQIANLRAARKTDAPRLMSMIRALAQYHGDQPTLTAQTLERDVFRPDPWVHVIVADIAGDVVGYATLCPLVQLQFGLRGLDMPHLFVDEAWRGGGLGKRLIEASIRKARDLSCSYIMVGTHPDNLTAQAAYLACGFERRPMSGPRFFKSLRD